MKIERTHEENRKIVEEQKIARIFYNWWGNANIENRLWQLLDPNGDLEDYHSRKILVEQAKKKGWKYQVERHCKKRRGVIIILEKNY
jgi:hypothetical protein